jgi:hypothetical protein
MQLAAEIRVPVAPLLKLAMTESHAQGVYLYHVDRRKSAARAIAWAGLPPVAGSIPLEVQGQRAEAHFPRSAPFVLQERAWQNPVFDAFPEFRTNRFEGVVSIPFSTPARPKAS